MLNLSSIVDAARLNASQANPDAAPPVPAPASGDTIADQNAKLLTDYIQAAAAMSYYAIFVTVCFDGLSSFDAIIDSMHCSVRPSLSQWTAMDRAREVELWKVEDPVEELTPHQSLSTPMSSISQTTGGHHDRRATASELQRAAMLELEVYKNARKMQEKQRLEKLKQLPTVDRWCRERRRNREPPYFPAAGIAHEIELFQEAVARSVALAMGLPERQVKFYGYGDYDASYKDAQLVVKGLVRPRTGTSTPGLTFPTATRTGFGARLASIVSQDLLAVHPEAEVYLDADAPSRFPLSLMTVEVTVPPAKEDARMVLTSTFCRMAERDLIDPGIVRDAVAELGLAILSVAQSDPSMSAAVPSSKPRGTTTTTLPPAVATMSDEWAPSAVHSHVSIIGAFAKGVVERIVTGKQKLVEDSDAVKALRLYAETSHNVRVMNQLEAQRKAISFNTAEHPAPVPIPPRVFADWARRAAPKPPTQEELLAKLPEAVRNRVLQKQRIEASKQAILTKNRSTEVNDTFVERLWLVERNREEPLQQEELEQVEVAEGRASSFARAAPMKMDAMNSRDFRAWVASAAREEEEQADMERKKAEGAGASLFAAKGRPNRGGSPIISSWRRDAIPEPPAAPVVWPPKVGENIAVAPFWDDPDL